MAGFVIELDGVVDEVLQHDAHEFFVGLDLDVGAGGDATADLDLLGQPFFLFQQHHLADDAGEVDPRHGDLGVVDLVDDEEAREDGVEPFRGDVQFLEVVEGELVLHVHEGYVAHSLETGQRAPDVVGGLVDEVVELVVDLFEGEVDAFEVHGLLFHLAVEVLVLGFEELVLLLDRFLGFGKLGVDLFGHAVGPLQHQDQEPGQDGDDGDGHVEVALLTDHGFIGGDGFDVLALSEVGLDFGDVFDQAFGVDAVFEVDILRLI